MTVPTEKLTRIRELAELIQWARSTVDEPWDGAPDYMPGTITEQYLAELDPDTVLELVAAVETGQ